MASSDGFGLDHLPYGVFGDDRRVGVRYGDRVLDLSGWDPVFASGSLNAFLALGRDAWDETRARVRSEIEAGAELTPLAGVPMHRPVDPPDYVDFYSSIEHASNVGRIFRPDADPLLPNWRALPVGYHGRSSTVVVDGTPIRRPHGQLGPGEFGPSRKLDFELELGFVTGDHEGPVPIDGAGDVIFGVALVNDWSARDIQRWEYQPLGPFLGKSFATSIAAWVTPLDALASRRVPQREQDPEPHSYLRADEPWALDIDLEVHRNGAVISRVNARGLYWTMAQQLAHASVNGARVSAGDLYASGTISGPEPGTYGSMLELSWGEEFLDDGDALVLRGSAGAITLAEVGGTVVP
jgi:fumarylacetoacetase